MVILIFISFIILCAGIDLLVRYNRKKKSSRQLSETPIIKTIKENNLMTPKGLYFGKGHMWAYLEKNGQVKIGIDDFIGDITGKFNRVKMKTAGEPVKKGQPAVSLLQQGKQLTINSPVSGTVSSINEKLLENSEYLTASPYSEGWIYSVEPSNWEEESRQLLIGESYKNWKKNEFTRLKDLLAVIKEGINADPIPVIYQDGGELKKYFLEDFGPREWEDFQTNFINSSI